MKSAIPQGHPYAVLAGDLRSFIRHWWPGRHDPVDGPVVRQHLHYLVRRLRDIAALRAISNARLPMEGRAPASPILSFAE